MLPLLDCVWNKNYPNYVLVCNERNLLCFLHNGSNQYGLMVLDVMAAFVQPVGRQISFNQPK